MTRLVLVDFDRTLFDTSRFTESWWRWAGQNYPIDMAHEIGRMEEYIAASGLWRRYDFYTHVRDLGLGEPTETTLEKARLALSQDFTFGDAKVIFELKKQRPMELITYGYDNYQSYKISFVPELESWTKHITAERKEDYIKREFKNKEVVLIDDKPLSGHLPENVRFIHLDRPGQAKSSGADRLKIASLAELTDDMLA